MPISVSLCSTTALCSAALTCVNGAFETTIPLHLVRELPAGTHNVSVLWRSVYGVTVSAGGNSPAGVVQMQLYVDGKKAFDTWNDQLKKTITVGAGKHRVAIIAIDRYRKSTTKAINVTAN